MSELKSSIGSILMTMCQKPTVNTLLDEQRYNSTLILNTLDEFYRTVTQMEAKVLGLQYVSFSVEESFLNNIVIV